MTTKATYLNEYAEAFTIFAKYSPSSLLDLDYYDIAVHLVGEVTPEDTARLVELGWDSEIKYGGTTFSKSERFQRLSDLPEK